MSEQASERERERERVSEPTLALPSGVHVGLSKSFHSYLWLPSNLLKQYMQRSLKVVFWLPLLFVVVVLEKKFILLFLLFLLTAVTLDMRPEPIS